MVGIGLAKDKKKEATPPKEDGTAERSG